MSLKTELREQISSLNKELTKWPVGTEEHKACTQAIATLTDRYAALEKMDQEAYEREVEQHNKEVEQNLKRMQIENEHKRGTWANWLTGFATAGGIGLTVWGTRATWKAEEKGIVASMPGRKFVDRLFKFIK